MLDDRAREEAFRLLLKTGEPVSARQLAGLMKVDRSQLIPVLEQLHEAGRIRRDKAGRVVGAGGLSVVPDRHSIKIGDRTLWTWCAYDILGIMGALKADGSSSSRSPATGRPIELEFRGGRPEASGVVLFRPDESFAECCTNVYEQWCPNSNFFEDEPAAQSWSARHGVSGRILNLAEAADEGSREWAQLVTP